MPECFVGIQSTPEERESNQAWIEFRIQEAIDSNYGSENVSAQNWAYGEKAAIDWLASFAGSKRACCGGPNKSSFSCPLGCLNTPDDIYSKLMKLEGMVAIPCEITYLPTLQQDDNTKNLGSSCINWSTTCDPVEIKIFDDNIVDLESGFCTIENLFKAEGYSTKVVGECINNLCLAEDAGILTGLGADFVIWIGIFDNPEGQDFIFWRQKFEDFYWPLNGTIAGSPKQFEAQIMDEGVIHATTKYTNVFEDCEGEEFIGVYSSVLGSVGGGAVIAGEGGIGVDHMVFSSSSVNEYDNYCYMYNKRLATIGASSDLVSVTVSRAGGINWINTTVSFHPLDIEGDFYEATLSVGLDLEAEVGVQGGYSFSNIYRDSVPVGTVTGLFGGVKFGVGFGIPGVDVSFQATLPNRPDDPNNRLLPCGPPTDQPWVQMKYFGDRNQIIKTALRTKFDRFSNAVMFLSTL